MHADNNFWRVEHKKSFNFLVYKTIHFKKVKITLSNLKIFIIHKICYKVGNKFFLS